MQFCAKNAKNYLNPTDLVKRNFCFEMEGVLLIGTSLQQSNSFIVEFLSN
jgi:hypothetical protein